MHMKKSLILAGWLLITSAASLAQNERQSDLRLLTDNVFNLSEVMLHDVTPPTGASRFYAYALLGAYQVVFNSDRNLPDINSKLKEPLTIKVEEPSHTDVSFCANYVMLDVGRQLMPSGSLLAEKQAQLISHFRRSRRLSRRDLEENIRYSQQIAQAVVQYARDDNYNKLSTFSRYKPSKEEGRWYPTPPEYMAAIDPEWQTIRPFFIDSANQFAPPRPAPYSRDTTSAFFRMMKEVYLISRNLTSEQKEIANFWDCNPFAVTYSGHLAIGLKKISPGGHWMSITGIACRKANMSPDSAVLAHTLVAMTLHDAFISCWQEKYASDRVRPEAAINKLLDPSWRPLLQTPPFPEYSSGHSVASSSVAVVLTRLFGDNFSYTDNSEVYFGLPERKFGSFYEAAREAAVSRIYGGIHFRDACEQGFAQGERVGSHVLSKVFGGVGSQATK